MASSSHTSVILFNLGFFAVVALPCVVVAARGLGSDDKKRKGMGEGALVALIGLALSAAAFMLLVDREREAKAGWNLVPIIVAADTLKAGDLLTYDVISQRPVPEQFVPTSWVLPDHANEIVGKKLVGPAQAGDPISMFLFGVGVLPEACAKAGAAHAR